MLTTIPSPTPWHPGRKHANNTLNWLPSDSKERFEQLLKDPNCRKTFEEQGWLEPDAITYTINQHGFRSEEFEPIEPGLVTLGCSFTLGTGLPVDSIWPTLVGQALNLKVYNLAWGGNAMDTCYRLARFWIPVLRPKLVCMLAPPKSRVELATAPGTLDPVLTFLPHQETQYFAKHDEYLKNWFVNDDNAELNFEKNKLAIAEICRTNNVPFLFLSSMDEHGCKQEKAGSARDFMHAGPRGHRMLSDKFLKMYNE